MIRCPSWRHGAVLLLLAGSLFELAAAPPEAARQALARGDDDAVLAVLEPLRASADAATLYLLAQAYANKAERSGMLSAARLAPKARETWEQALQRDAGYLPARFALLDYYAQAPALLGGSAEKAAQQQRAIQALDALQGLRAQALLLQHQGQAEKALQLLRDGVRQHPQAAAAQRFLGQHLARVARQPQAALDALEAALRLDADDMLSHYEIGRTAALSGLQLERGEQALRRYLGHQPQPGEPGLAAAHFQLGLVLERRGQIEPARQALQQALQLRPGMQSAREALQRLAAR